MLGWWSDVREPVIDAEWISAAFRTPPQDAAQRHALLSGRKGGDTVPRGRIICSCFSVGERAINEAIASGFRTPAALGGETEMWHQLRLLYPGTQGAAGGKSNASLRFSIFTESC